MKHLFFTTSVEFKAYYDYWIALMCLHVKDRIRNGDARSIFILENGLNSAALAKAKYNLREPLSNYERHTYNNGSTGR